ncbi:XRE family transcriptional regulator [Streptomyces krungchingensis]|uniref:XRE family transcriptional regulator n=1 Tax=Streptomyces krungchingensis TaxID=1565034 RepID=UPI003CF96A95
MTNPTRKGAGQPLRDAMKRQGLTQATLAARTREIDERGKGVSLGTVVKITGRGRWAVEECRDRTARLLGAALREPLDVLFSMPIDHTHTVERCDHAGSDHPH